MTELHLITAWWSRFLRFYLFGLLLLCAFFPEPAWANDDDPSQPPADPWFSGTMLSTRGSTLDKGHMFVAPYFYVTGFGGLYKDLLHLWGDEPNGYRDRTAMAQ